ncbi:MAG: hypothetical protein U5K79_07000 [Cyclobacteriaceae bacterium]|nr:hypothetical protein [Cyclobacteriaceae bacterium]
MFRYYRSLGFNYRKVVIAGYGKIAIDLKEYFASDAELGYRFMGYFDNLSNRSSIRGKVIEIVNIAKSMDINEIYCILPYLDFKEVDILTKFAEDNFIKIHAIPDYRGFLYKNIEVQLYDFIPVLTFSFPAIR